MKTPALLRKLQTTNAIEAARLLLGQELVRELNGAKMIGKIVETEAYFQDDPASHSFRGQTPRTSVMFGPAGFAYVYFTYGMHYCINVSVGAVGMGAAVLIRALEPVAGLELMRQNRRNSQTDTALTNGPAKLTQAFGIDKQFNGHDLSRRPLYLRARATVPTEQVITSARIGIRHAVDAPYRFFIKDNPFVSRGIYSIREAVSNN